MVVPPSSSPLVGPLQNASESLLPLDNLEGAGCSGSGHKQVTTLPLNHCDKLNQLKGFRPQFSNPGLGGGSLKIQSLKRWGCNIVKDS